MEVEMEVEMEVGITGMEVEKSSHLINVMTLEKVSLYLTFYIRHSVRLHPVAGQVSEKKPFECGQLPQGTTNATCSELFHKWGYVDGECQHFKITGCTGGTAGGFNTMAECQKNCDSFYEILPMSMI